ncbi:Serine/threonine-protein kinase PrkC [Stieleria neptunia]|uniref:Serine/threonine-protein kinase PrkC n=1 Tax=Stieleria neptunia TaxID=2527979 RepID=A0A518HSP7_9BACT|nr:serine/threonine-protein kinase [Stieleria neptunia]QDV43880.1 Serine/threonine-protein kinase PrkC [Stieleria neptunia]
MNPIQHCPIDQLQCFVDDALPQVECESLITHLDHCAECRDRISRLAGSAEDWAVAKDALSADELTADRLSAGELSAIADSGESSIDAAAGRFDVSMILRTIAPSDDPRSAGRIGPFEVTGIIGTGGMGVVLKACEPALDRFVAIKMLSPHLASSTSARKRFAREARAAAAVLHENVIAIYQVAHFNDVPYLVMPYLADPSLQQRIDDEGCLDIESTLSIGMQIAKGLAAAHSQGLVHRDVKPANVLLSKGTERAVITDFGLARAADDASLTRAGTLAGTPHYMSPEQAKGQPLDLRSDLFSLGSVLFTMLAGHPPIRGDVGSETITRIAEGRVPSLSSLDTQTPDWLIRLVDWLHQDDPHRRPKSADDVAGLLEQCLSHYRQPGQVALPDPLARPNHNRRRMIVVVAVAATIAAIFLAVVYVFPMQRPSPTEVFDERDQTSHQNAQVSDDSVTDDNSVVLEAIDTTRLESDLRWDYLDEQIEDIDRQVWKWEQELGDDWESK